MNPVPALVPKSVNEIADRMAREAHQRETRSSGEPYILHVERVADRVSHNVKALAMLHDVIENNVNFPESHLRLHLPDWLVDRVVILTRRPDEPYDDYIIRVAQDAACREVKAADLSDNIKNLKPGSLRDKYRLALHLLVLLQRNRVAEQAQKAEHA
jgi:(p)ppGpp synthase/HD superfamily hydrolase